MRLQEIYEAASTLFIRQGYSKTQISHIAKAVGVSVGTIYLDFAGKKDIVQFILQCVINPSYMEAEHERPIARNDFGQLEEELRTALQENNRQLAAHLTAAGSGYTFENLLSDAFDLMARYAVGILFIEKNQYDFLKLADYYRQYRREFFGIMEQYFTVFTQAGVVRRVEYPRHAVRNIIETLSWWAIDIHYNAFETQEIEPETAKAVALDCLVPAYIHV